MKEKISPRVGVIALAVVLVIVGFIGWKMFAKPKQAHIVFGQSNGENLPAFVQSRKHFADEMLRTGRSPDAYSTPPPSNGQ